jgi:hypothetical protein
VVGEPSVMPQNIENPIGPLSLTLSHTGEALSALGTVLSSSGHAAQGATLAMVGGALQAEAAGMEHAAEPWKWRHRWETIRLDRR